MVPEYCSDCRVISVVVSYWMQPDIQVTDRRIFRPPLSCLVSWWTMHLSWKSCMEGSLSISIGCYIAETSHTGRRVCRSVTCRGQWRLRQVRVCFHGAGTLLLSGRLRWKCDGTRAETRWSLSAKRTSPFKSAGALVQSTTGSRSVGISGSNAGYTMFRGSVKCTG